MLQIPESLGKSEGFVAFGALVILAASVLLCFRVIDGSTWQTTVLGTVGVICAGGAAAAYRR